MLFRFELNVNGWSTGSPAMRDYESEDAACEAALAFIPKLAATLPVSGQDQVVTLSVVDEAGTFFFETGATVRSQPAPTRT